MTLTVKNKFYLHIAISILIFGCLTYGSYFVFGLVKAESKKLTNQKIELAQIQEKRTKVFEASQEYEKLKETIEKLNSSILSKDEELKFIVFVENTAKQNSVNYDINISGASDANMIFQVSVSGRFENILNFIKQMENSPYYASIANVNMARVKDSLGSGDFKGKLNFPLGQNDVKVSLIIKVYTYAEK